MAALQQRPLLAEMDSALTVSRQNSRAPDRRGKTEEEREAGDGPFLAIFGRSACVRATVVDGACARLDYRAPLSVNCQLSNARRVGRKYNVVMILYVRSREMYAT